MATGIQCFVRLMDRISEFTGKIAAWMFFAIGLFVCFEVFMRYVLIAPTIWVDEPALTTTAMIFIIIAGAKVFSYAITLYLIPQMISGYLMDNISSPTMFIQAVGKARIESVVKGAWPFAVMMLATVVLLWFFKDLVLYIPYKLS